ncbi:hypothetical protein BH09BAC2_BH09BAC2_06780 [soil metagenome]
MALTQIAFEFDDELPKKKKASKPAKKPDYRIFTPPVVVTKQKRGRKSLKPEDNEVIKIDVPDDEHLFQKSYYSMGEVTEMFKLNGSLLRYWEKEFDILKPRKNKKGDRHFRPEDVKNLRLIHHLLRERKYTIEGAKDFLKNGESIDQKADLIQSLQRIKNFLLELKTDF